jgi:hypothetical protein
VLIAAEIPHIQFRSIVPPGTHYCWVARGSVDSKLAQGFYAYRLWSRESNPRPFSLWYDAFTSSATRSCGQVQHNFTHGSICSSRILYRHRYCALFLVYHFTFSSARLRPKILFILQLLGYSQSALCYCKTLNVRDLLYSRVRV